MIIYPDKYFKEPKKVIVAFDDKEFKKAFYEIEKLKNTSYLVGYIRYEAKDIFLGGKLKSKKSLLYFEVHDSYEKFDANTEKPPVIWKFILK